MKELLEALKIIKGVCQQHEHCWSCPLFDEEGNCPIGEYYPSEWELVDEIPEIRLFKEKKQ